MRKSDVQELYREAKRHPHRKATQTHRHKQGCSTCGKVTWKPGR